MQKSLFLKARAARKIFRKSGFSLLFLILSAVSFGASPLFSGHTFAQGTPPAVSGVVVYQDTSCTTADIDGHITGTYNVPLTLKYQIGSGTVHSVSISVADGLASTTFAGTMTDLKPGSTYFYWLLGSVVGDTPFGNSTFTFTPTTPGCDNGIGGSVLTIWAIPGSDKVSANISGTFRHGVYDPASLFVAYRKSVNGAGPVEDFTTKPLPATVGDPTDSFSITLTGLSAADYEYHIGDKNTDTFAGSSGTFSFDGDSADGDQSGIPLSIQSLAGLTYTHGVMSFLAVKNIEQTMVTVYGKMLTKKVIPSIRVIATDGSVDYKYTPTKILSDGSFSDQVKDLDPDHNYALVAVNPAKMTEGYSWLQLFHTHPITLLPNLTSVSSSGAILSVQGTPGIKSLSVVYGTKIDALTGEEQMPKGNGMTYNAVLKDLTPDTKYFYKIKIVSDDSQRTVTYSDVGVFLSGEAPPTPSGGSPYIVGPSSSGKVTALFKGGIVPCSGVDPEGKVGTCHFDDIIKLFSNVITFLMFLLAPGIAALVFLYGGLLILTSGGNTEKIGQAKKLFMLALTGILITFCAWIIVKTVLVGLGYDTSYFPAFY